MTPRTLLLRGMAAAVAATAAMGCAESRRDRATAPEPELDAYLEMPSTPPVPGSSVVVMIRLAGDRASHLASFTGRVAYDTAGLTFVREISLTDGATRVSNPTAGLIRAAAIKADGFGDAPVAAYEFTVKSPSAVATMALTVEELHDAQLGDSKPNLRVTPLRRIKR